MQTMHTAAAAFLTMREIIALSQTYASAREPCIAQLPHLIHARFLGRKSAPDDEQSLAPWKFAALLEDRGSRARILECRCRDVRDIDLLLYGDMIIWQGKHYWARSKGSNVRSTNDREFILFDTRFASIPAELEIPRDFPLDYFRDHDSEPLIGFNLARYRAQLLATLDYEDFAYDASFAEHGVHYRCEFVRFACIEDVRVLIATNDMTRAKLYLNGVFHIRADIHALYRGMCDELMFDEMAASHARIMRGKQLFAKTPRSLCTIA